MGVAGMDASLTAPRAPVRRRSPPRDGTSRARPRARDHARGVLLLRPRVALPAGQRRGRALLAPAARRDARPSRSGRCCPAWSAASFEAAYREAVGLGRPVRSRRRHRRAAGRLVRGARLARRPTGWPSTSLDVTDRRGAEEAARRAAARLTLLAPGERRAVRRARHRIGARPAGPAGRPHARPTACIVTVVDRDGRARDVGSLARRPGAAARCWSGTPGSGWTPCRRPRRSARALHGGHAGHRAGRRRPRR